MKNQTELKAEMWNLLLDIRQMKQDLRNSKNYLNYLNDCLKQIQKQEEEEVETNEHGDEFVGGCATCGEDTNSSDINGNCKNCK